MFLVVKIIVQSQQTFLISIAIDFDVFENFNLIERLVKVLFVILNNFKAIALVVGQILDFDCVRKLSLA